METKEFSFDLPDELIAKYPPPERGSSRLLVVDRSTNSLMETSVPELPNLIPPGSLLVFNDSKVRKARVFGKDPRTGRDREFLFLRSEDRRVWEVLTPNGRKLKEGQVFLFPDSLEARVAIAASSGSPSFGHPSLYLRFPEPLEEVFFERHGVVPLPPYIRRAPQAVDAERYQTVYAQKIGSVAAPTAGLHFTEDLLRTLEQWGVQRVYVTLHVGIGTFKPIRTNRIEHHRMHREEYEVTEETALAINAAKREGRKIVAVGTTSVRVLESVHRNGVVFPGSGYTELYITPGFRFQVVDHLFTNFHTPGSTLLVLVSAFAGLPLIREAYAHAIQRRFRFFSYGDAMLIL